MDTWVSFTFFSIIVNNTAMDMGVQVSFWDPAFNYFVCIYPAVELWA